MPKFLEDALKQRYGANSSVPFKIMNAIGAMHGNKETAKGVAMEAKHEHDMKVDPTRRLLGRKGRKGGVPAYNDGKYGRKS